MIWSENELTKLKSVGELHHKTVNITGCNVNGLFWMLTTASNDDDAIPDDEYMVMIMMVLT